MAIKINEDHYELITELFHNLNDIYETHIAFGQMVVVLEYHMEKRGKASKAFDQIVDWKRYMKDKPENIIILSSFQLKKVRTVLHSCLDLNEMVKETIKKAQAMCGRRWYVVDGIMETLCFPIVDIIENACPLRLMIDQVELR